MKTNTQPVAVEPGSDEDPAASEASIVIGKIFERVKREVAEQRKADAEKQDAANREAKRRESERAREAAHRKPYAYD